jgi:N-acetylneuraminic acid mutarotase
MLRFRILFLMLFMAVPAVLVAQSPEVKVAPLPLGIASFGAVVHDGSLYVYGGHTGKTHTYSLQGHTKGFFRVSLAKGGDWETLPSDAALQGLALVADSSGIYRIGGMTAKNKLGDAEDLHSVADVAKFDPATKKWTALPPLPAARSSHRAAIVDGKIYVFGGWQLNGDQKKATWPKSGLVLDLSAAKPQWKEVAQPFQRRAMEVIAFAGKVWAIGGLKVEGGISDRVDIFDPATGKWTSGPKVPGMPANGNGIAAAVANDCLCVAGMTGTIYGLNKAGESWQQVGKMPSPRIHHRLVNLDSTRLLVIAGATRDEHLKEVVAVQITPVPKK